MTKIDLITGFLGSGKTTFLKLYASHFLKKGERLGILENDYGAVNVDMMLLSDLEGESCTLETVAGACDADCHRRRFKTKLIAMGMSGYDRVIVEPSGIFDADEFFDVLREDPLDRWFEIGAVIAVVDPTYDGEWSRASLSLLSSQAASAGAVVFSKTQLVSQNALENSIEALKNALALSKCDRDISGSIITKRWSDFTPADLERISESGFYPADYIKTPIGEKDFSTLYLMSLSLTPERLKQASKAIFSAEKGVRRIKGFCLQNGQWYEFNSTQSQTTLNPIKSGQDVVIIIGEGLDKEKIKKYLE
ncbi:MAG: GTP-binding protein [Ruminococcus sp.]|nr:GTP-binding protein [Ruminococcus sp.]